MKHNTDRQSLSAIELPTVALIVTCYSIWLALALLEESINPFVWVLANGINITLFMSITHEVLHGHPTRNKTFNEMLIFLPIGWSIPYERFRDTHLDHHTTGELTDPFDDPESWYLASHSWSETGRFMKYFLMFNNSLLGRMLVGPILGLGRFYVSEFHKIRHKSEDRRYLTVVWTKHLVLCSLMAIFFTAVTSVGFWQLLASIYLGHSLLLVRTFLEHQATPELNERTVIIEKPCPLAFLFLFNNYHFIHHNEPGIPWYRLPRVFRENREHYISLNNSYIYKSYGEIFRRYFLCSKEPVRHPFLHTEDFEKSIH